MTKAIDQRSQEYRDKNTEEEKMRRQQCQAEHGDKIDARKADKHKEKNEQNNNAK